MNILNVEKNLYIKKKLRDKRYKNQFFVWNKWLNEFFIFLIFYEIIWYELLFDMFIWSKICDFLIWVGFETWIVCSKGFRMRNDGYICFDEY